MQPDKARDSLSAMDRSPFYKTMSVLRAFRKVWAANDLDLISAGVAFYGVFSIFPALAASIAIFGLVADPAVIADQLALMQDMIPKDVFDLFEAQVSRLLAAPPVTLGWASILSLGIALYSARAGVGALVRGLNAINGVKPRHGLWHFVTAFLLTLALVGVALVALALVVVAPIVLAFVPLAGSWSGTIEVIRWGVVLFVLFSALGILYRYGPNTGRTPFSGLISVGAVFAVVLWFAASFAFSYYLANFGRYADLYGSLGAVVAMLMWLYISSYLVLLGCVLNVAISTRAP